jgi:hypothetical protein
MSPISLPQKIVIVFEKASDWINIFSQTFWLGTDICHAKLLFTVGSVWYVTELTYDGVQFYQVIPDDGWFIIDNACEAFRFNVTDSFVEQLMDRCQTVYNLGLQWSNWYAVHAILNGKFPSLNCVSYLSYLLLGVTKFDLPDKLREELSYEKYGVRIRQ